MIATNEELALLEKWKRKLCLQEWRIKLLTHLHPEETLSMLPLELADREIDKSWWFFNTFVITLK